MHLSHRIIHGSCQICLLLLLSPQTPAAPHEDAGVSKFPATQQTSRFIKLNESGQMLKNQHLPLQRGSWSCVRDNKTGLVWEIKTANGGLQDRSHVYTWYDPEKAHKFAVVNPSDNTCAVSPCNTEQYIKTLNSEKLCGSSSWRLPEREELRSLIIYDQFRHNGYLDQDFFPNNVKGFYWSATLDHHNPGSAWGIGTTFGFDYSYSYADPGHIRLVNTAPDSKHAVSTIPADSSQRYKPREDGTVLDTSTGTIWSNCQLGQQWDGEKCIGQPGKFSWKVAQQLARGWKQNGQQWDLPDLGTLSTLWLPDSWNPAITLKAFPETRGAAYWTSTAFDADSSRHWVINFYYGENDTLNETATAFARPVLNVSAPK